MGFYNNSEVDSLLEEGYALTDPAARKEKYDRIQEIIAEELPYIFLLTQESATVYNNEFTNFESLLPSGSWKAYDKVWWTKGELPVIPTPPTPPIGEEIEPRIESLEESVENLSTKISSLETQLSSLESKMGSLEDKIGTIPTGANVAYGAVGISVIAIVIAIAIYFITKK